MPRACWAAQALHSRKRIKTLSDWSLAHQLMGNDVRLAFLRSEPSAPLVQWMDDRALRLWNLGLVPDACVEYGEVAKRFAAFLELDRRTESLDRWVTKVQAYLRLAASGRHRAPLGRHYFRVLAVAPSRPRLEHLRAATAGLTDRMFWFADVDALRREGPFGGIWLRPTGRDLHELTEP